MTDPKGPLPFSREKFLFRLLAGIFIWQASVFTFGMFLCMGQGGLKACPSLGDRYENTVNVMIATTLALLGTSTLVGARKLGKDEQEPREPAKSLRTPQTRPPSKP